MQMLIQSLAIILPLTAIMATLFAWLRQDIRLQGDRLDKRIDEQGKALREEIKAQGDRLDKRIDERGKEIKAQGDRVDKRIDEQGKEIKAQGDRVDKRIDEQGKDIKTLIAEVAALKATVETFFRLRVDPPPDDTDPGQVSKAA